MSDRAIIEALKKITGLHKVDQVTYVDAEVKSVDVPSRTCVCTVIVGHTEYELPGVALMSGVDDGLLIEPSIRSGVKVIFSELIDPFVCQYSEIENITIDAKTKIKFNDGSFGGVVKAGELVAKVNVLEDDLNALKQAFSTWIVVPNDGGAALKAVAATWAGQSITKTIVADISNNTVIHGK